MSTKCIDNTVSTTDTVVSITPSNKSQSNPRFAFDSEGNQMSALFSTIEEIRKGSEGEDLKLPQMCVIGMQSSGKSSLLTSISGLSFPEASKTCTKCPIVVNLRKENTMCLKLNGKILESQAPQDKKLDDQFQQLQNEIKTLNDGNSDINDKPINIEYFDPNMIPLTLIDLPGIIINSDEGQKTTERIIEQYIKPSNTVILVVQQANLDKDTTGAGKLAKKYDKDGLRTVEIFTKADEVVNLQNIEEIIDEINNQKPDLFATHIVSCRDSTGGRNTYESEMDVFRQDKWYSEKYGQLNIKDGNVGMQRLREEKLPKLLADNIMQNLPILEADIETKLDEAKNILKVIGEKPLDKAIVIQTLYKTLEKSELKLQLDLTPIIEQIAKKIIEISKKISRKDTDKYYSQNCFEPVFFEGSYAFAESVKDFSNKCMDEVEKKSKEIIDITIKSISEHECIKYNKFPNLKNYILQTWKYRVEKMFENLISSTKTQVYDISNFNTRNHYLTSKFKEETSMPKEQKEIFAKCFISTNFVETKTQQLGCGQIHTVYNPISNIDCQNMILEKLNNITEEYYQKYQKEDIQEQQKTRVFNAVEAYVAVIQKTFFDQMIAILRRVIIDDRNSWQTEFFLGGNQILLSKVEETKEIEKKRKMAIRTKESMVSCRQKLSDFRNWLTATS